MSEHIILHMSSKLIATTDPVMLSLAVVGWNELLKMLLTNHWVLNIEKGKL